MILDDPRGGPATTRIGGRATLDGLLRQAARRRPDDVALLDPPNRESFTDGKPRRPHLCAGGSHGLGHRRKASPHGARTDAIVGIQIANTVESVLTLLGVLRAGLIAMPLPLLWRRAESVAALGRVGASALIVSGRIGAADHSDLAMRVAAEVFPIRHVGGYGRNLPDGLLPFDDLFSAETLDPIPSFEEERAGALGPAAHLAVITWDVCADGLVPVARSHAELIAGGLAVVLESRLAQNAVLLSTLTLSSFAALATAVVPWLAARGHARAAPAVRCGGLPRPDRHDAVRHHRRSRPARRATRGSRAADGERRECHRRLAGPGTAGTRAVVARDQGAHDRRAGVRRSGPVCRPPRAGGQPGGYPLRHRARSARSQGYGRGAGDRVDAEPHGGTTRSDGAACAVSAGR